MTSVHTAAAVLRSAIRRPIFLLLFGLLSLSGLAGCDGPPPNATGANPPAASPDTGVVRLTAEKMKAAGITVQPLQRGEFRTFRDFPGTVEPNEHALADITTLVRGRVIDVYADLGREVKGGTLLALLYSSELGMAQSAYLKATAKLNVADRAFRRAELLLKEKVIGVAELQRREGEMLSLRAELREARDRLLILGLTDEDLRNLDRNHTIRSHVPVVAPFDGRIIARNLTKGEVVVLCGPSGSGKSTMIRTINRLEPIKSGRIQESLAEHRAVMAALEQRDAAGAMARMQAHFASGLEAAV